MDNISKQYLTKAIASGVGFVASLALMSYGLIAGISGSLNTAYVDLENECVNEYYSSDEFIARVDAKHDELTASLRNGEITNRQLVYEYGKLFDDMATKKYLRTSQDELGEKFRDAEAKGNEETRNVILGSFALVLGIVGGCVSGGSTLAFSELYREERKGMIDVSKHADTTSNAQILDNNNTEEDYNTNDMV